MWWERKGNIGEVSEAGIVTKGIVLLKCGSNLTQATVGEQVKVTDDSIG